MMRAHKIALDPNNEQATRLAQAAGTARFAYNWALARWLMQEEAAKADPSTGRPSEGALRRELTAIKREQYPWMWEVTKCAPQEAIIHLGAAFKAYGAGRSRHPRFKKRGVGDSFKVTGTHFRLDERRIYIAKLGWLRMTEAFRFPDAKVMSVTISRRGDRWFASVTADVPARVRPAPPAVLGVDVGVAEFVLSDGSRLPTPRPFRRYEGQLRRADQAVSRKQKGSKNREKARLRVTKLHIRIGNVRRDWLHKTTTAIAESASVIGIERLDVVDMVRDRKLAKSVYDAGFATFRRQLEYKVADRDGTLVIADRWFPSSKICSACGTKTKSLPLSLRTWTCGTCNVRHDRDLNAAINLMKNAASSAVSACGEFSASAPVAPSATEASTLDETGTRQRLIEDGSDKFWRTA
jgi:putative transposase